MMQNRFWESYRLMLVMSALSMPCVFAAGCGSTHELSSEKPTIQFGGVRQPTSQNRNDIAVRSEHRSWQLDDTSSIADYVQYTLDHNPGVEAAHQQWMAQKSRIDQVGALPNPSLKLGYFFEEVETRVGPQRLKLGIQQSFPWPGTLAQRQGAALQKAKIAQFKAQEIRLDTIEKLMHALHDLSYVDGASQVLKDDRLLLASFEEVVRARYRLGTGTHPELIRIQIRIALLEDRIAHMAELRVAHFAQLKSILCCEIGDALSVVPELVELSIDRSVKDLLNIALLNHPSLRVFDAMVIEQDWRLKISNSEGKPAFTVGIESVITDRASASVSGNGRDPILLSVGMTLPIWRSKTNSAIKQAQSLSLAAMRKSDEKENQLSAELYRIYFKHTDAQRRLSLYRKQLIPKSQESLKAFLASFRTGQANFTDILDAQTSLLEFALVVEAAKRDLGKSYASLQAILAIEPVAKNSENRMENN